MMIRMFGFLRTGGGVHPREPDWASAGLLQAPAAPSSAPAARRSRNTRRLTSSSWCIDLAFVESDSATRTVTAEVIEVSLLRVGLRLAQGITVVADADQRCVQLGRDDAGPRRSPTAQSCVMVRESLWIRGARIIIPQLEAIVRIVIELPVR